MIILVYIKPNQFWLNCHAPSKDNEWWYICVLSGVGFIPFYDFSVGFWTFLYGVVCFPFHFNHVTISLEYHTHLWHMYTVSCGPPLRFYHFHIQIKLWTFHSYVATFQQYMHMEYISFSWYDIPELVVPSKEAPELRVPLC